MLHYWAVKKEEQKGGKIPAEITMAMQKLDEETMGGKVRYLHR
jgi:hypothetical protein